MTHSIVPLGNVAEFIRGVTYKPQDLMENFSKDSVVCMRTANIQESLIQDDIKSIPASLIRSSEKFLRNGDILVSTANSWNLVGKCCWVPELAYAAVPGGFIACLRADPKKVDARYLYHWFNSPQTQTRARNCGRQTTNISNMDLTRCLALMIPLPSLVEQRRIATILDKADALRAKRREAIAKLDQLLQAVFLDMFGSSREWIRLADAAEINPRNRCLPEVNQDDLVPFIPMADIDSDEYIVSGREWRAYADVKKGYTSFQKGDVLIAKITPCFENGKIALANIDHHCGFGSTEFHVVRPAGEAQGKFLLTLLRRHQVRVAGGKVMTGSAGQKRVPKAFFQELLVPVASSTSVAQFAGRFDQIQKMKEKCKHSLETMNSSFSSLQQHAFRGA